MPCEGWRLFLRCPPMPRPPYRQYFPSASTTSLTRPLAGLPGAVVSIPPPLGKEPLRPTVFTTRGGRRGHVGRCRCAPDADSQEQGSVLPTTSASTITLTVTHTLWRGSAPACGEDAGSPTATSPCVDLIVTCLPFCYSLSATAIDRPLPDQPILPSPIDWEPGARFVTPPGTALAPHKRPYAHLVPLQDAASEPTASRSTSASLLDGGGRPTPTSSLVLDLPPPKRRKTRADR